MLHALIAAAALAAMAPHHFQAASPTGLTGFTQWAASYRGSVTWSVSDHRGGASYAESSSGSYEYRAGRAGGPKTFSVTFPTPCVQYGPPCPQRVAIAVGNGIERITYQVTDASPIQTLACTGRPRKQLVQPGFSVRATYIRSTDSDRIVLDPQDASQFNDPSDSSCPGPNPAVAPLGDWYPTFSPGPAPGGVWTGPSVDVPASVFAHNRLIAIPFKRAASPSNCGLPSGSGEVCTLAAGWSGTVVLHRL